jgi:formate hydrogenlyase subunit 6/NADH:ubiquinone oxidoreductase subunit I
MRRRKRPGYFKAIIVAAATLLKGLGLTGRHMRQQKRRQPMSVANPGYFKQPDGPVTILYPREAIPVPDTGRYRLFMETPDCIGCDQCARVCPVDCIDIVKIKAVEDLGLTTDGSKKRFWLPVFDIDMAKCCFCGLCTVVCPTECLTMTKNYDYATQDRQDFIFHFGNLKPEEALEKQAELAAFEAAKTAAKAAAN